MYRLNSYCISLNNNDNGNNCHMSNFVFINTPSITNINTPNTTNITNINTPNITNINHTNCIANNIGVSDNIERTDCIDYNADINKHDLESILVFEYYTASGINDPNIISEAKALIKSLLEDLKELNISLLISPIFKDVLDDFNGIKYIWLDEDLEKWLSLNVSNFDSCIFIAAEENMNLYNLTKLIESNGVKIYGCDSDSTLISSDKYETFKKLENIINQPKTFKIAIDSKDKWKITICNILTELNSHKSKKKSSAPKLIVKPIIGVDCQDTIVIYSERDINPLKKIFPTGSIILVQEFIEGDVVSVSLITNNEIAIPVSLNKQYILMDNNNHSYHGGKLPYNHKLKDLSFHVSKTAIENIKGLKGFVGVDLILTEDEAYFLEINSRFTTPYVGLQKVANFNIAKSIIKFLNNEITSSYFDDIIFKKSIEFRKNDNDLIIKVF